MEIAPDLTLGARRHAFFRFIVGEDASENSLSRLFCACFLESPAFAQTVLTTIWEKVGVGRIPKVDGWECHYQPTTPLHGGGRPDFCLIPPPGRRHGTSYKPIFVESKLEAKLTERQLRKYRMKGTEVLVALTKNWPEVSQERLDEIGVKTLRWQDIRRALRETSRHGQKNKFVCDNFAMYLEETGMAYREDIKKGDLENIRSLLLKIASQESYGEMSFPSVNVAFVTANNCLELLKDVKRRILEKFGKLNQWKSWGPGYHHNFDPGEGSPYHAFGFGFYPVEYKRSHFDCYMSFPASRREPIGVYLEYLDRAANWNERELSIGSVLTDGSLDEQKVTRAVVKAAEDWNIV
jgi:hypothetical protein